MAHENGRSNRNLDLPDLRVTVIELLGAAFGQDQLRPVICKRLANQRPAIEPHATVSDGRCDQKMRRSAACPTQADTSWHPFDQTVNLPAHAYRGSNPRRPTSTSYRRCGGHA